MRVLGTTKPKARQRSRNTDDVNNKTIQSRPTELSTMDAADDEAANDNEPTVVLDKKHRGMLGGFLRNLGKWCVPQQHHHQQHGRKLSKLYPSPETVEARKRPSCPNNEEKEEQRKVHSNTEETTPEHLGTAVSDVSPAAATVQTLPSEGTLFKEGLRCEEEEEAASTASSLLDLDLESLPATPTLRDDSQKKKMTLDYYWSDTPVSPVTPRGTNTEATTTPQQEQQQAQKPRQRAFTTESRFPPRAPNNRQSSLAQQKLLQQSLSQRPLRVARAYTALSFHQRATERNGSFTFSVESLRQIMTDAGNIERQPPPPIGSVEFEGDDDNDAFADTYSLSSDDDDGDNDDDNVNKFNWDDFRSAQEVDVTVSRETSQASTPSTPPPPPSSPCLKQQQRQRSSPTSVVHDDHDRSSMTNQHQCQQQQQEHPVYVTGPALPWMLDWVAAGGTRTRGETSATGAANGAATTETPNEEASLKRNDDSKLADATIRPMTPPPLPPQDRRACYFATEPVPSRAVHSSAVQLEGWAAASQEGPDDLAKAWNHNSSNRQQIVMDRSVLCFVQMVSPRTIHVKRPLCLGGPEESTTLCLGDEGDVYMRVEPVSDAAGYCLSIYKNQGQDHVVSILPVSLSPYQIWRQLYGRRTSTSSTGSSTTAAEEQRNDDNDNNNNDDDCLLLEDYLHQYAPPEQHDAVLHWRFSLDMTWARG